MYKNQIIEKDGKKYIDDEEILYEYDCYTNWIFIRHLFLLFGLYATYFEGYIAQGKHLEASIVFILLFIVMIYWLILDIKTLINRGIYITANNIITFSGKTISLDDIYYIWGGGGTEPGSISLRLYDKSSLIIVCLVKDDEYYDNMIDILQSVSSNKNLKEYSPRDGKRKLKIEATVD